MDNETYKQIVLMYIPYGVQVQYEGILNSKEKADYKKEYDAKLEKMWNLATPPTYNPPKDVVGLKLGTIKKVSFWKNYTNLEIDLKRFALNLNAEPKFKLVLRPLSDLHKEINGVCIPNLMLAEFNGTRLIKHTPETIQNRIDTNRLHYLDAIILFKYHFDVFGLIPKGLAVDINTLTK